MRETTNQLHPTSLLLDTTSDTRSFIMRRWLVIVAAVLVTVPMVGALSFVITPYVSNDSFQYLSVAQNLLDGNGISTSIIYYEEQRQLGQIPAPQCVFPPGYPLAVMAVCRTTGLPLENAALMVSLLSFVATLPLIIWIGTFLQIPFFGLVAVSVFVLLNSYSLRYARSLGTEAIFTAATMLSLGLCLKANQSSRRRQQTICLLLGALVAGFTSWFRYAGYFLVLTVITFYGINLLLRRDPKSFIDLIVSSSAVIPVAVLLIRNQLVSGGLQGGNTKPTNNPVVGLLKKCVVSFWHLVTGDATTKADFVPLTVWGVAVLFCLIAVALLLAKSILARPGSLKKLGCTNSTGLLVLFCCVYMSAILYAAKTTPISFGPRMLYPIVPVVVLLVSKFIVTESRCRYDVLQFGAVVLCVVCYIVFHGRSELYAAPQVPHRDIWRQLAEPGFDMSGLMIGSERISHLTPS